MVEGLMADFDPKAKKCCYSNDSILRLCPWCWWWWWPIFMTIIGSFPAISLVQTLDMASHYQWSLSPLWGTTLLVTRSINVIITFIIIDVTFPRTKHPDSLHLIGCITWPVGGPSDQQLTNKEQEICTEIAQILTRGDILDPYWTKCTLVPSYFRNVRDCQLF